jgi:hypothetical protein
MGNNLQGGPNNLEREAHKEREKERKKEESKAIT